MHQARFSQVPPGSANTLLLNFSCRTDGTEKGASMP